MLNQRSLERLKDAHPDLQRLVHEVAKRTACFVVCTWRSKEEQTKALASKVSKKAWPASKHNLFPSYAVDLVPYNETEPHIRWQDIESFKSLGALVKEVATEMNLQISWGGDWRMRDYPHFELKGRPAQPVYEKPAA